MRSLGLRVWGVGFRVQPRHEVRLPLISVLGFRAWGLGLRVESLGFIRVSETNGGSEQHHLLSS